MKVKSRMMFHFFAQLFFTFIAILMVVFWLIMLAMYFISKDQLEANPKSGIIENLPYSTFIEDGQVDIKSDWEISLEEEDMWLQIVNHKGDVIYAYNTPTNFYESYTINDLLVVEETKQLDTFTVATYLEIWESQNYYFLFGYREEQQQMLAKWYESYGFHGKIQENHKSQLESAVRKQGGMLEVYQDGELIEKMGENLSSSENMLEVVGRTSLSGYYETKAFVVNDENANSAWVYQVVNTGYKGPFLKLLSDRELEILLIVTIIIFLIPILLSFWNGYRYGKPLLLFIDWLKILEEKRYDDLLTGNEHAKIFKKNGKVKFRYRLYKEVFVSFSEMSRRLASAEQESKQLEKTREEWMAGISHDLRTPLSSVQGYGHLLESGQYDFSQEELQQMGQVIRDKSDYMVGLVNDFSLVFQLKNSAVTIQKESIHLNDFLASFIRYYADDVTLEGYRFVFEGTESKDEAWIDPKWFTRVIDNLLSNAIKHNPKDTIIKVQVLTEDGKHIIRISDNGRGMDEEFVGHLFNRYYRGTTTNERSEGEGLGMSIAYAIVELHGANIHVQSEIDRGTTIDILLQ